MTWASVVHSIANSTSGNGFTSGAIDTTGANFIVVGLSTIVSVSSISDSKGNTWNALTGQPGPFTDAYYQFFYAENPTVGSGHTFTVAGSNIFPSMAISAWSGGATSSSFDVENGNGVYSTSVQTGNVTPGADNELIIAGLHFDDNSTPTINSSFTVLDTLIHSGFGYSGNQHAYIIETTATAKNPTFSWTGTERGTTCIATFKSAAATGIPNKIYQSNFAVKRAAHY